MKASRMSRPDAPLLAEAALALVVGAAATRAVAFRALARRLSRKICDEGAGPSDEVEMIRRAIDAWTRRLPLKPKCFARGLAAFWMLRRRHLSAQLFYGAATIGGELKAHVWVRSGDQDVVGCDIADQYALLATFPESSASDRVSAG